MLKVSLFKNRRIYQFLTGILVNFQLLNFFTGRLYTGKLKSIPFPVLNCYACPASVYSCPIGTLAHFMIITKVPLITIGIVAAVSTTFGRWICGWICPFGLVQDLLYKIPSMKFNLPKHFVYLKYLMLVLGVILLPLIWKEPYFCMICPTGTLEAGIYWIAVSSMILNMAGSFFLFKLALGSMFLYGSIFIKRPFCRYICPLGALFSIFNKFSIVDFKVDKEKCIECNLCRKSCPVDYPIYKDPNSPTCLRCLNCVKVCKIIDVNYPSFLFKRKESICLKK
ncbi:4Fe-4S binding protein [Desulfurobacterium thermolithotrophum]|uniref:4Fe-4S binding protein n=1 Tax=Desulfurobacterium thermolithotrophum TaxID=64160 RepID=UPI0013D6C836|nr:4Fe-4S binding protein [Desulfurobacterium thermolithotrophum]